MFDDRDENSDCDDPHDAAKRKRIPRACDVCRLKKIRCNGGPKGKPCSMCKSQGLECTFTQSVKPAGPPKGYVEQLERRIETMELLLSSLSPRFQCPPSSEHSSPLNSPPSPATTSSLPHPPAESSLASISASPKLQTSSTPKMEFDLNTVQEQFSNMNFSNGRYLGPASGINFEKAISQFRKVLCPNDYENWSGSSSTSHQDESSDDPGSYLEQLMEADAIAVAARYQLPITSASSSFILNLIHLYFDTVHLVYPILHPPSFYRDFHASKYTTDRSFRALVFGVIAVAARFSDDPAVSHHWDLVPPFFNSNNPSSTYPSFPTSSTPPKGLAFYWASSQLTSPNRTCRASIYDIQATFLQICYLLGCAPPAIAWSRLNEAITRTFDIGFHRQACSMWTKSALLDEQRKRVWWGLYSFDRRLSCSLGRPLIIQDADIDTLLPFDISDDDLEKFDALNLPYPRKWPPEASPLFPGPLNNSTSSSTSNANNSSDEFFDIIRRKSSSAATATSTSSSSSSTYHNHNSNSNSSNQCSTVISGFISCIKLTRIMGWVIRTIYSLNKDYIINADKIPMWEQRTVAELDSALNSWLDQLPWQLRNAFDNTSENRVHSIQCGVNLCLYYSVQLLIHRDFLPRDRQVALGFPSFAICLNAAKSMIQTLDHLRKMNLIQLTWASTPLQASGSAIVILMDIYNNIKSPEYVSHALTDVHKVLDVLDTLSPTTYVAGMLRNELGCLADMSNIRIIDRPNKRRQDSGKSENGKEEEVQKQDNLMTETRVPQHRKPTHDSPLLPSSSPRSLKDTSPSLEYRRHSATGSAFPHQALLLQQQQQQQQQQQPIPSLLPIHHAHISSSHAEAMQPPNNPAATLLSQIFPMVSLAQPQHIPHHPQQQPQLSAAQQQQFQALAEPRPQSAPANPYFDNPLNQFNLPPHPPPPHQQQQQQQPSNFQPTQFGLDLVDLQLPHMVHGGGLTLPTSSSSVSSSSSRAGISIPSTSTATPVWSSNGMNLFGYENPSSASLDSHSSTPPAAQTAEAISLAASAVSSTSSASSTNTATTTTATATATTMSTTASIAHQHYLDPTTLRPIAGRDSVDGGRPAPGTVVLTQEPDDAATSSSGDSVIIETGLLSPQPLQQQQFFHPQHPHMNVTMIGQHPIRSASDDENHRLYGGHGPPTRTVSEDENQKNINHFLESMDTQTSSGLV